MKVTYVYHSCFIVELEKSILIFDYFKGQLPQLSPTKHIYLFASHKHQDHFSMEIFGLFKAPFQVTYILANDIRLSERYLERLGFESSIKKQIVSAGKCMEISLHEDFTIKTLKSTDAGVAFIIETEGVCLYHAGDLNWWHWKEESDVFNLYQERVYAQQLEKIRGQYFDAAFLPLDYRLGDAKEWGLVKFLEMTEAETVFPMHMWEHYELIDECLANGRLAVYKDRIVRISAENESWTL
ncbi:MAG TPA: MBL fold metallo-hydrolase [Lachnospiraceae bacterium]|nr:MBL fold metallo-hydrolase [Lachnospiraceae bacterium]